MLEGETILAVIPQAVAGHLYEHSRVRRKMTAGCPHKDDRLDDVLEYLAEDEEIEAFAAGKLAYFTMSTMLVKVAARFLVVLHVSGCTAPLGDQVEELAHVGADIKHEL